MIIYLGIFYLLLGTIILLFPIIYLEFGRPKDLIKAGLILTLGMILIFEYKGFNKVDSIVLIVSTTLIIFFALEIFVIRWNQLTDNEKKRFKTYDQFKKNINTFFEAVKIGAKSFLTLFSFLKFAKNNENIVKKKWVRNSENDTMLSSNKKN